MASLAYKLGQSSGLHQDVHIYVGTMPGQRARAGVLRVRHDELADLIAGLDAGGFERVASPSRLIAPPEETGEER